MSRFLKKISFPLLIVIFVGLAFMNTNREKHIRSVQEAINELKGFREFNTDSINQLNAIVDSLQTEISNNWKFTCRVSSYYPMKVFRIILYIILSILILSLTLNFFTQQTSLKYKEKECDFLYSSWKNDIDSINELNIIIDSLESQILITNSR